MTGYDPTSIIRASIFLAFLSISLFAVFLSCKDRCLYYSFSDTYWLPLWVGIMGLFLGVFGVAMGCSKRSSSRSPPCVGTVFCEFIFVFMFACLGCLLIISRPILALYGNLPSIQLNVNITYVTDLLQRNITAIEDYDTKYTNSFILWGALSGIAICLVFLSFCMSCMYCCCCQDESASPTQPKPKAKTNRQNNLGKQTKSAEQTGAVMTMTKITNISSPSKGGARPPAFAPSLSGNTSQDVILFSHASAPHFSTSPTLSRDYMETQQGTSSGNSIPPGAANTPMHTIQRHSDTPLPDLPTSTRPTFARDSQVSSNDGHDDDHDDPGYVLPNDPTTSTIDSSYVMPQSAPAEYIDPISDENYEQLNYNYAYEHDLEELSRSHGTTATSRSSSVSQFAETNIESITNITKNDRLDEYNYPYEHEVEELARNRPTGATGISYY